MTEKEKSEQLVCWSAESLYRQMKEVSAEIDQTLEVFEKIHNEAECMGDRSYRALVEVRGLMELSLERLSDNGVKEE